MTSSAVPSRSGSVPVADKILSALDRFLHVEALSGIVLPIEIAQPAKTVGQTGDLVVNVDTPGGQRVRLDISLDQNGRLLPLFSLSDSSAAQLTREGDDRIRVTRAIGKRQIPELETGNAGIVVTAVRPVLFGYREIQSTAAREVEVRLTPPQIAVQSTHHYINHGGSEMVVYRVAPADAASGVRVGNHEYSGFPASGAGFENADPALRVGRHRSTFLPGTSSARESRDVRLSRVSQSVPQEPHRDRRSHSFEGGPRNPAEHARFARRGIQPRQRRGLSTREPVPSEARSPRRHRVRGGTNHDDHACPSR